MAAGPAAKWTNTKQALNTLTGGSYPGGAQILCAATGTGDKCHLKVKTPPHRLCLSIIDRFKKNRTMSELMREAYREYERKRRWDEVNDYGREKAAALGIAEKEVARIVKKWRKEPGES